LPAPDSFQAESGLRIVGSDDRSRRLLFLRLLIFSYATMTGTGYSDLTPSTDFARMATCLEAMTAQVYLAVIIARLVGIYAVPPAGIPPSPTDGEAGPGRGPGSRGRAPPRSQTRTKPAPRAPVQPGPI